MKRQLFSSDTIGTNRRDITVEITPAGELLMDGCDNGPLVKELFGKFDFEYSLTILEKDLPDLFNTLASPHQHYSEELLLELIADRFGHEQGFLAFKEFLIQQSIPARSWSF
ncbi:MAG: hypothetical protein JXA23_09605 [Bacteroidales bacterium]|nr:hypothetical protein [Bacteroidales bacterium]